MLQKKVYRYPSARPASLNTPAGALGPSAKSTINSTCSNYPEASTGQKRKYNGGLERTLTKEDSFSEQSPFVGAPQSNQSDKLYDAVYFDENDFDEDSDLILDLPQSKVPLASEKSSDPIPWSPSPSDPTLPSDTMTSLATRQETSPLRHEKRRKLPWLDKSAKDATPQSQTDRNRLYYDKEKKVYYDSNGNERTRYLGEFYYDTNGKKHYNHMKHERLKPDAIVSKDSKQKNYPWNTMASTVKDEQKKIRKQSKAMANTDNADEEAAKKTKKLAAVFLSDEQRKVASMVVDQGKSIFFTGSAGTGKSVLMREIIRQLRLKYRHEPDRVAVTASTGLAACNIEGVTLHSFAGIGLGKEDATELIKQVKYKAKAKTRWQRTKVLVIDEISMVDGSLFDKLEQIARGLRSNGRPFGGLQLVVTGDFFQLPPVPDGRKAARFCFDANTWNTSIEHTILLTQVFRQRDPVFANMLNEMRVGKLTPKSIETFKSLSRPLSFLDEYEATELFPTRAEVDKANEAKMASLSGVKYVFSARDSGSITDPEKRDKLLSNCMAPQTLELKKGAQVMLIKNLEDSLVNGSPGRVVGFMNEATWDYHYEHDDDFVESQEAFDIGKDEGGKRGPDLKSKMHQNPTARQGDLWPLVQFTLPDGTYRRLLCQPEAWKVELPTGEVQAQRSQVPLILAWALSIHKAQGQTLERVKVDMGKIFERGQAYVALSRATTQSGLQVLNFDRRKVMAHPRVTTFYSNLVDVETATRGVTRPTTTMPARKYESGHVVDCEPEPDKEDEFYYMYN